MRTIMFLVLVAFTAPAFAQSPADLYSFAVPGTVQLKYDLLLDQRTVEKPELVNRLLRLYRLKELGSSLNLSSGTGVVVSADGKIVTNSHVVTLSPSAVLAARSFLIDGFNAMLNRPETNQIFSKLEVEQLVKDLTKLIVQSPATLKVQVNNKETRAVRILTQDVGLDLALVQSDFIGLVPLKLSDSSQLKVGEDVLALGYPLGKTLEDMFLEVTTTMTKGSVSAMRSATLGIQHSASITHGNSGGPLVNLKGEVVGINSAGITEANNLNLAIPSNTVKKFLKEAGFGSTVEENARLSENRSPASEPQLRNRKDGKGMVVLQGLTPGTKVTVSGIEQMTVPATGTLTLEDLPFGEVRIEADLPVYDKVYQPYYVFKEKSVLVNGYAPGLTLRLDDVKDYVVPANGVLELPVTFDKPHSLVAQPGWGRGFETSVLLSDETAYRITVPAGSLTVSGLPQRTQLTLNGNPAGFPDQSGTWSRDYLPVGLYRIGVAANYLTTVSQQVEVKADGKAAATIEVVPAASLAIRLSQAPEDVALVVTGPSGLELPAEVGQVRMVLPGEYRVQARRLGDEEPVFDITETLAAGEPTEILVPLLPWSAKHQELLEVRRNAWKGRIGVGVGFPHTIDINTLWEWERWKAMAGISVGALLVPVPASVVVVEVAYTVLRLGTWDFAPGLVYSHFDSKWKDSHYTYAQSMEVAGAEVFVQDQGGFFATFGVAMAWNSDLNTYRSPQTQYSQAVVPVINIGWNWIVWH